MRTLRTLSSLLYRVRASTSHKRFATHAAFVGLISLVAWQAHAILGVDRSSLLYALISGEEIVEGPLDPLAYAQTDGPGIGGARLAAIDVSDTNLDLITFEDPEVAFSQNLEGTVLVAPLQPLVPEPGSETAARPETKKPTIHTVQAGETIASIAADTDVSVNTILWANGLSSKDTLKVGDHLTILPTTGVLHTVRSGDTVSEIASKYDAKAADVIAFNHLSEDAKLGIGQKVIVPDGYIAPATTPTIVSQPRLAQEPSEPAPPSAEDIPATGLVWPTSTRHISQYFRWGHTGIDIDNRSRPPIYAAAGGTVEFAGWLGGYGKLLIVNHGNGLRTYYGHLDQFYSSQGEKVDKGQSIAKMGSTGRSTGPHLHFEVRKDGRVINPLSMYD